MNYYIASGTKLKAQVFSVCCMGARAIQFCFKPLCILKSITLASHHTQHFSDIISSNPHNWRRQWHPTPMLLPGKSHGQRSLVGCSPWGLEESDTTERLHFHFSLCCIGEGNGNPLQCSCLENPRDGGAWWAAVYGVAHSRTRLKRLSSSSMHVGYPLRFAPKAALENLDFPL